MGSIAKIWLFAAAVATSPAIAAPAFDLTGKGVQIYTCTRKPTEFAWVLKAPDAALTDANGAVVGHHLAGPSWQGKDGSFVTGDIEYAASGAPGAVKWLVLRAKTHGGTGLFSDVQAILRTDTVGGAAPASGCDARHVGAEARVKYSARYSFLPK